MIYTVTFNPSLDYIVTVPDFTLGVVNRTTEEIIFPGGKGIAYGGCIDPRRMPGRKFNRPDI